MMLESCKVLEKAAYRDCSRHSRVAAGAGGFFRCFVGAAVTLGGLAAKSPVTLGLR